MCAVCRAGGNGQFVPFRNFADGDDYRIAEATLAEIPAQLSSYLELCRVTIPTGSGTFSVLIAPSVHTCPFAFRGGNWAEHTSPLAHALSMPRCFDVSNLPTHSPTLCVVPWLAVSVPPSDSPPFHFLAQASTTTVRQTTPGAHQYVVVAPARLPTTPTALPVLTSSHDRLDYLTPQRRTRA